MTEDEFKKKVMSIIADAADDFMMKTVEASVLSVASIFRAMVDSMKQTSEKLNRQLTQNEICVGLTMMIDNLVKEIMSGEKKLYKA